MTKSFDLAKQLSSLPSSGEVKIVDQTNPTNSWKISSVGSELLFYYDNGTTVVLKGKLKPDGTFLAATNVGII